MKTLSESLVTTCLFPTCVVRRLSEGNFVAFANVSIPSVDQFLNRTDANFIPLKTKVMNAARKERGN